MKIILDYPIWIYFVCILVGVVFSFLLYRKQTLFTTSKVLFWTLVVLRFSLGFSLTLLLFNPLLQYKKRIVEKPIVAILHDNSSSIVSGSDSTFIKNELQKNINELAQEISSDYKVDRYTFGQEINQNDSLNFLDKQTNISAALQSISDQYYNQNLAAVILLSDGIYNEGVNPEYLTDLPNASVFSIALGDTSVKKDLLLNQVSHNRIAFSGNKFPIKVSIKATQLAREKTILSVSHDSKEIYSKEILITENDFFIDELINIEANKSGIQKYDIQLKSIEGEHTRLNNSESIYVEVLNSKQKILLLANAPHPDLQAIRDALETNKNYDIKYSLIDEFNKNSKSFDAIILHNLPSKKHPKKVEEIVESSTPTFFILGNQADYNKMASFNAGVSLSNVNSFTEYAPSLNKSFSLFQFNDKNEQFFKSLAPLNSPFSAKVMLSKQNVLATQKVGNVSTDVPLIGFNEYNQKKSGYILGEGIWRWKIQDYKLNQTHDNFNAFILKSMQYLSAKDDKSFFRVFSEKNTYNETETIILKAELYNKAYELVNTPEVSLILLNDSEDEFSFIFSKEDNHYQTKLSGLEPGNYSYKANTELNGEKYEKAGAFSVTELKNELLNTVANHQLLSRISEKTNGKLIYPNNFNELKELFKSKENFPSGSYSQTKSESIINLKWLFGILIVFLAVEWFIRKREGGY